MWFAIVGKRTFHGTSARTRSPSAKPEPRSRSAWSSPKRYASTSSARVSESSSSSTIPVSRHLPAARRVEGRLAQLREEEAVLELLERADLREHVRLRVADELRLEARLAREVGGALELARAACARDLAVALHLDAVAVDVDRLAALLGELDRELERESRRSPRA